MEKALRAQLSGGTFADVSPVRSRAMSAVKGKGNKTTERRLRLGMVRAGIRGWQMHRKDVPGRPDFFFAHQAVAVFVDGCFWHGCPECGHIPRTNSAFWAAKIERNRSRDAETKARLSMQGILVLRFWEHQLRDNLAGCLSLLEAATRIRT